MKPAKSSRRGSARADRIAKRSKPPQFDPQVLTEHHPKNLSTEIEDRIRGEFNILLAR